MKKCPGNCDGVLLLLRQNAGWHTFEQLGKLGMKMSERRRINTLVKLGLVERREIPSKACRMYAEFRATPPAGMLFDVAPDPLLMHSTRGMK